MSDRVDKSDEGMRAHEPTIPTPKARVIGYIREAQAALINAHRTALAANSLAGNVPCILRLQGMQAELSATMMEVNKLQGL